MNLILLKNDGKLNFILYFLKTSPNVNPNFNFSVILTLVNSGS